MPDDPESPQEAKEAATDKAGQIAQPEPLTGEKGQYEWTSTEVEGGGGGEAEESPETYSIIIELKNDQDKAVSKMPSGKAVKFQIKSGTDTQEGVLGDEGKAEIHGLPEKKCEISFIQIIF